MNKERVALVHGYLTDREGKDRPDRLTRIGILTAAELYRNDEIDKICFTGKPELSDSQAARLKILLNNPPEKDIVVNAKTVTTRGEVQTFKEMSEKNDWENLLTIGNNVHLPRIRKEIKKAFKDIDVESVSPREILCKHPRYSHILSEMENWEEQISLSFLEKVLNTPIIGSLALSIIPHLSKYKVALQYRFFNQLEK